MAGYLLGVDGGGTRTHTLLTDLTGRVIGEGEGGPSNALAVGWSRAEAALRTAIDQALHGRKLRVDAAVFGLAGVMGPDDQPAIHRFQRRFPFITRLMVENDGMVALYAATRGAAGVLINAGTGTIAVGRNRSGRVHRADGWGYVMGDEGSAYDIGIMALRAAMRAYDDRGPRTGLLEAAMRYFQATSPHDLVRRWSRVPPGGLRTSVAGLVPIVEAQARRGDREARRIVQQAATHLTRTALSVLRQVPDAAVIYTTGGALAPGSMLYRMLLTMLRAARPALSMKPLQIPPVAGAVLMACRLAGADEARCWRSLRAWGKVKGRRG